jgi:hypothetical protein
MTVSKQAAQKMDMERVNLKNLNEGEIKEQYHVTLTKKSANLENLQDNGDINSTWDINTEDINISAKESLGYCKSKHHIPQFDEECLNFVDRRKQAKLQLLQNPSEVKEGNISNVRWESSRHLRNKKGNI